MFMYNTWHFCEIVALTIQSQSEHMGEISSWEDQGMSTNKAISKLSLKELTITHINSFFFSCLHYPYISLFTFKFLQLQKCLVILVLTSNFHFWHKYPLIGVHESYWQEPMNIKINEIYLIRMQALLCIQQNTRYWGLHESKRSAIRDWWL